MICTSSFKVLTTPHYHKETEAYFGWEIFPCLNLVPYLITINNYSFKLSKSNQTNTFLSLIAFSLQWIYLKTYWRTDPITTLQFYEFTNHESWAALRIWDCHHCFKVLVCFSWTKAMVTVPNNSLQLIEWIRLLQLNWFESLYWVLQSRNGQESFAQVRIWCTGQ